MQPLQLAPCKKKNFSICSLQEKGQVFTLAILCVEEDTGEVT